jgi:hypothetical protein
LQQEPLVQASLQLAPPEELGQVRLQRERRVPVPVLKLASLRGFQRRKPALELQQLVQALNRRRQQRR